MRFLCWLLAISCFVWAHIDPRFRDAEGFLHGGYCLPITAGVAALIFGFAASGPWNRFAAWFALALMGQAVALQMVDAGHLMRYQHYRPLPRLLESAPWLLSFLGVQTALVLAGLWSRWPAIRAWLGKNFRVWRLAGIGLTFVLTSATVSRNVGDYLLELPFAAFIQAVNLANIALVAGAIPEAAVARLKIKIENWFGDGGNKDATPRGIDRFAMLAALWVTLVAAVLSFFSYERHPHVGDETTYLYQARYFAEGMLTMQAPPVLEAFNLGLMDHDEKRWFCSPPPGWPLILALGVLCGAPWLVNPALAGLNVLLAYTIVGELYDRRTARMATLLLCASPWNILMAMNFMSHTFTMTCALGACVAVIKARRGGGVAWAALGGAAAAMVSAIRPLDGLIVAGLVGLWVIGLGGRRLRISGIAAFVFGGAVIGAAQMAYNKLLTGSLTNLPIMVYTDKYVGHNSNAFGFGADRGMGWPHDPFPGHGPLDAMVNSNLNLFSINVELFGWATGSIILIALLIFALAPRKSDYLMIVVIGVTFVLHLFYWFSGGPDFGARYWYLMLIPCVTLTARGAQFLAGRFEDQPGFSTLAPYRVYALVLSLCVVAMINFIPWRAIDKYHHYLRMRPDIRRLAEERNFGRSLILIRGEEFPDYHSAAIYNPINLNADAPVYAREGDAKMRSRLLRVYRDRPVWIVAGPSVTGAGFKVVEGPALAQELLSRDGERLQ